MSCRDIWRRRLMWGWIKKRIWSTISMKSLLTKRKKLKIKTVSSFVITFFWILKSMTYVTSSCKSFTTTLTFVKPAPSPHKTFNQNLLVIPKPLNTTIHRVRSFLWFKTWKMEPWMTKGIDLANRSNMLKINYHRLQRTEVTQLSTRWNFWRTCKPWTQAKCLSLVRVALRALQSRLIWSKSMTTQCLKERINKCYLTPKSISRKFLTNQQSKEKKITPIQFHHLDIMDRCSLQLKRDLVKWVITAQWIELRYPIRNCKCHAHCKLGKACLPPQQLQRQL